MFSFVFLLVYSVNVHKVNTPFVVTFSLFTVKKNVTNQNVEVAEAHGSLPNYNLTLKAL